MKNPKSEILQELENNLKTMELLVSGQKFTIGDANKFLERYYNVFRSMEQLTISRAKWKARAELAESKLK